MRRVEGRVGHRYEPVETFRVEGCLIQPSAGNALKSTETRTSRGSLIDEGTLSVIGARGVWPGGAHSLVKVLVGPPEYTGRSYQQSGSAMVYNASPMTSHWRVRCDALEGEVK